MAISSPAISTHSNARRTICQVVRRSRGTLTEERCSQGLFGGLAMRFSTGLREDFQHECGEIHAVGACRQRHQ